MKVVNLTTPADSKNCLGFISNILNDSIAVKRLDNISLDIEPGSITVIIGPNGAGKTTLAKIMANIDHDFAGTISSNFKSIGYLPQYIDLNPTLPIRFQDLQRMILGSKDLQSSLFPIIQPLMPLDIDNKQLSEFSGGMLRRSMLALMLMKNDDLIILDEPTQNLDINGEEVFYRTILKMREKFNSTFVIISHNLHAVMKYADSVICLNKHICCSGTPALVSSHDSFLAMYSHAHDHTHG